MKFRIMLSYLVFTILLMQSPVFSQENKDPFLWLEDVEGIKSMEWVKQHDSAAVSEIQKYPEFRSIFEKNLQLYNSKERIAYPSIVANYIYNFWQDSINERGVWRRTSFAGYMNKFPEWETVLSIDSLAKADKIPWVYQGSDFLYPDYNVCLLRLSRGGADATVTKEFDLRTKKFVGNGFQLPEAKSAVSWIDANTLFVGTDFGEGSMTSSGYTRIIKIWKRGTPLSEAKTLFEGDANDVYVYAFTVNTPSRDYYFLRRALTFYNGYYYSFIKDSLVKLDVPDDIQFDGIFMNQMLFELKTDWTAGGKTYSQGSLISIDFDKFISGDRNFTLIYKPGERESIVSVSSTKSYLLINRLNNVRGELIKYKLEGAQWVPEKLNAPDFGTVSISSTEDQSDKFFFTYANFLNPTSLYFCNEKGEINKIKSLPEFFDSGNFEVRQYEAVSKDETKIPYFIVQPKNIKYNGNNPVLQYAYGGFEESEIPFYSGTIGTAWLSRGGIFVLANLRGGGEFGPKWHLSAIKEKRQKAYDDMIAVSEDLIQRKITSPKHLGIMGGSNGGLLVGVMFTQRPDLYNAVVCQSPLLDMKRYIKLLAGASWIAEFGNPDNPEEWKYIKKYSPYQNVSKDKKYPPVLFTTSTRDDRVHPGHARKMAALMESLGHKIYFYEYTEGGHSSGVTNKEIAFENALTYSYLWMRLGKE